MSKKLFVGRLPFNYTNEQLQTLFQSAGRVLSATMVPDPNHGRTRGFGFVAMATDDETKAAVEKLNGTRVEDKEIYVAEARPMPVRKDPAKKSAARHARPLKPRSVPRRNKRPRRRTFH